MYSRHEIVAEVTSLYEFLIGLYLPKSAIKRPPPGGWPGITAQYLAPLQKNETVVDLVRHLPFIHRDEAEEPYHVYAYTVAVDFTGEYVRDSLTSRNPSTDVMQPLEEAGDIPSHVLTIATPAEGIHGNYIHVDTERGTVVLCDLEIGPKPTELSQTTLGERDEWREYPTYTVKEFFQLLRRKFTAFEAIAINNREVLYYEEEEPGLRKIKAIYEDFKVFTKQYDKDACLERVNKITWWDHRP